LQFLFAQLGLPFLPTYTDCQGKVKTNLDKKNTLEIISSLDHLALNDGIKNPDASQEYILSKIPINDQWSFTIGAVYKNYFKTGFHTFVLSRNMLSKKFYKYPDNDESREKSFDYSSTKAENKFRYELSFKKNEIKYSLSSNLEFADYTNQTQQTMPI